MDDGERLGSIVMGWVCMATFISNLIVIVLIWRNTRLHNVANYLVLNLAITDLLLGAVSGPIFFKNYVDRDWNSTNCTLIGAAGVALCCESVLSLTSIAIDRYRTIVCEKAPERRLACHGVALTWFVSLTLSCMGLFETWHYVVTPCGFFCSGPWHESGIGAVFPAICCGLLGACFGAVFWMYCGIFHKARVVMLAAVVNKTDLQARQMKEAALARRMSLLVIVFIANWLPYLLAFVYAMVTKSKTDKTWDSIATVGAYSNSLMNPILYAVLDARYWTSFKRLVQCQPEPVRVLTQQSTQQIPPPPRFGWQDTHTVSSSSTTQQKIVSTHDLVVAANLMT